MVYIPDFQGGQLGPLGGSTGPYDCTAWAEAYAIEYHTLGQRKTTGRKVRLLSNEPIPDKDSPGLNLAQVDAVGTDHFGTNLDVRYAYDFDEWYDRQAEGQGSQLQGYYAAIADSRFDAGNGFRRNHDMFVVPGLIVMDPLANGRYTGCYKFHGEAYPKTLLKEFAGQLVIGTLSTGAPIRLGFGKVYTAFTKDNLALWRASVHTSTGYFFVYKIVNGVIAPQPGGRITQRTGGFSATCTPPRLYRWPSLGRSVSLVQLTSGSRKGQFIDSKFAKVVG